MGDRANICYKDNGTIYFYTHWRGSELPQTLADALERGESRWDDGQYLARIIFCQMIKDNWSDTTGYGISTYLGDNEHPIITVDVAAQEVEIEGVRRSFPQFIADMRSEHGTREA